MAHKVKCYYCQHIFNRDKEPYIEVPNRYKRYAHTACQARAEKQIEHNQEQLKELEDYIKKLFKYDKLPKRVQDQIKEYTTKNGYTYSGILGTLRYFFEIKGHTIEKANGGIGIVPYVYEDARNYWYDIWVTQEQNKNSMANYQSIIKVREIKIRPPQREPMKHVRKLFTFLDEEE